MLGRLAVNFAEFKEKMPDWAPTVQDQCQKSNEDDGDLFALAKHLGHEGSWRRDALAIATRCGRRGHFECRMVHLMNMAQFT